MRQVNTLSKDFYKHDTANVASKLLGKMLFRRLGERFVGGIVVETEAYYGSKDPASRAYEGRKPYNRVMFEEAGRTFIYNVHRYWMLNVVAHKPGTVGGILFRAIEPTMGVEIMRENRPVRELTNLTSGPGKLTQALSIDKSLNGIPVTENSSQIFLTEGVEVSRISTSHRIGVRRDLEEELRFYIEGNQFLSR
ncbi:MAG: DNA-3-methyladenine glycosylase [Candidatus Bathyarchaeia archaeon]